ncbi:23673_t:CDS:2, partial [Gigaspora rosea]
MIDIDDWFQSAIDDYELKNIPFENFGKKKKKIGRGGFGDIYSTTCKSIPSISAIPEVIALKGVSVGEEDSGMSIKRFLNELKLHSMAKNDRIIKFFGVSRDEDNDQYYLIIEFADGGDLRGYLTRNKNNIQWEEKLNLAIQITEGIAYIHNELNTAHQPTQRFELNYIIDRLKTTSLTPVFEDPIIPESETPSDLYLKIDNNFASLSIITDLDISTNIRVQHVSSSINSKNYLKTTVKPIKISLPLRTIDQNYDEAFQSFTNAVQNNNNWIAQIYIGNCYKNGHGIQANEKSALEHYE